MVGSSNAAGVLWRQSMSRLSRTLRLRVNRHFRRNNDCISKHLDRNVVASLHSSNLPLKTIRKFARRTRDYLRVYKDPSGATTSHADVEKLRRKFKCHRGSIDFDFDFIRDA